MNDAETHVHYPDDFVTGLEWMWGEGFLSPGGPEEVEEILRGKDIRGARVLDIGCGLGGIDVLLVNQHGAAEVIGIDIEAALIERAKQTVKKANLSNQIQCRLVQPGPLPFDDNHFDVVFSKDSLIHITDKAAIFAQIYRVLKPNGVLALGDWLGAPGEISDDMQAWLDVVQLKFRLATVEQSTQIIRQSGFVDIQSRDRNEWYQREVRRELASISGKNFDSLVEKLGRENAEQRVLSTTAKSKIVDSGELRPCHIHARKPLS